ncbi:NUP84 [Candida theae]|uniref:Nuclear pore complex protein n=1 Tax=Candida theae TaxID=1198502 RepID=A0AAD5BFR3_9ASCO|nr:NUP84 [Candida theae]KAI5959451.1 NUP84 [Candida theae]
MPLSLKSLVSESESESIKVQFAKVLENQLAKIRAFTDSSFDDLTNSHHTHPALEIVQQFGDITSQRAFQAKLQEINDETPSSEEFEYWDLETKLWRLVEALYSIRLSSSATDNELEDEELKSILNWLQENSVEPTVPDVKGSSNKLLHTGLSFGSENDKISVQHLDADAPLRSKRKFELADDEKNSEDFANIYKFVILGQIGAAIDYAKNTGNFTTALILVEALEDRNEGDNFRPKKEQNRSAWIRVLYKLSQEPYLSLSERLIWAYLSGGDIGENLSRASSSYEEYLNVLIQKLLVNHVLTKEGKSKFDYIHIPPPQARSISEILDVVSAANGTKAQEESTHPIRVISGSVMINTVESIIGSVDEYADENIFRVLTHLAIFLALVKPLQNPGQLGDLITLYISKFSKTDQIELIPLYLSFIPNETKSREVYSLILSSVTDKQERSKHLQAARRNAALMDEDGMVLAGDVAKDKLDNVLKMIVEKVMHSTASHYDKHGGTIVISDEDSEDAVSEDDVELCSAVAWLYDNNMFEDAINATAEVIRRFLRNGKLTSLRRFAEDKNFKSLVSAYNLQVTGEEYDAVSENTKLELASYENFVEGLRLLDQWRSFTADNNTYDGSTVEAALAKTTKLMNSLILNWFQSSEDRELVAFRESYVPYLIMELLTIYENAREKDWKYIRLAFDLANQVADDEANDLLRCFEASGQLKDFLKRVGQLSATATERGLNGLYCL